MKGLVPIVEGFSSSVFKTEDGACLKVARSAEAASRLRHAFAVSAAIAPFVDVAVPQAVRWLPATEAQPHGGVLCAWIEGAQLSAAADPGTVAAFLRDLHAVDPTVLRSIVAPLVDLTQATLDRWSDYPYYGGAYDEIVPHLSLAFGTPEMLEGIASEVERFTPISTTVREVTLLTGPHERMEPRASFALGGRST